MPARNVSNVDLLEGLTSGPPPPPPAPHASLQLMGGLMPGFQPTGTGEVVMPLSGACGIPPQGNLMMMMGMGCIPGHQVSGMTVVPGQPGSAPSMGASHPNAALTMNQNMSMVSRRFCFLSVVFN